MRDERVAVSSQRGACAIDPEALQRKLDRVIETLRGCRRVLVAFSGGVDSTLLATLCRDALGKANALAVTADSASLAREDLEEARRLAARLDLEHLVVPTREVEDAVYRANTEARCYVCKHELFRELEALAQARHIPVILYGAIGDDQLAERPGQRAAVERGVRAPLQEAGLSKAEVRALAKSLGLPNWVRPQNACLSSRIPFGEPVTPERLSRIERAEHLVKTEGFRLVRVRSMGSRARIEVGADEVPRLADAALRARLMDEVRGCGFDAVEFDPKGYRSVDALPA